MSDENQQDRETKLRHQFQTHWDERERLHEQDLVELRQRFDKHIQTERTQKEELERELARVNRELVAVRQDAEVLGRIPPGTYDVESELVRQLNAQLIKWKSKYDAQVAELQEMQRIHKLQADQILKANEDKQELRNQVMLAREREQQWLKDVKRKLIDKLEEAVLGAIAKVAGDHE